MYCREGYYMYVYGLYRLAWLCMAGSEKFSVIIRKELYGLCSTRANYGASRRAY